MILIEGDENSIFMITLRTAGLFGDPTEKWYCKVIWQLGAVENIHETRTSGRIRAARVCEVCGRAVIAGGVRYEGAIRQCDPTPIKHDGESHWFSRLKIYRSTLWSEREERLLLRKVELGGFVVWFITRRKVCDRFFGLRKKRLEGKFSRI